VNVKASPAPPAGAVRGNYMVSEGAPGCPEGKPWGVVFKDNPAKRVDGCGCHATQEGAMEHMVTFIKGQTAASPPPRYRPPAHGRPSIPIAGFTGRRDRRTFRSIEFRAVDEAKREADIRVCVYNVVDDYGTVWLPGVWRKGLEAKKPKGVWGHDWLDPIGRCLDFTDGDDDLRLLVKFSDFEAVPQAWRAWTQLRDGDIDEFSFSFDRIRWEMVAPDADLEDIPDGARELMHEAVMLEWSPVLIGAVPGTGTLAVRSRARATLVPVTLATELATRLATGQIDLTDALLGLRDATVEGEQEPEPSSGDTDDGDDDTGGEEEPASTEGDRPTPDNTTPAPEPETGEAESPADGSIAPSDEDLAALDEAIALAEATIAESVVGRARRIDPFLDGELSPPTPQMS
jgi:HK97 family phage prohead protease